MIRNFEQGARKAGKDPKTMPRMIEVAVAYTDDADAAVDSFHDHWAGTMVRARTSGSSWPGTAGTCCPG
jgi:coenzyme F420-dependent glucose-6-phosphate dehydrogenase